MAQLLPNLVERFFDSNGAPLVGGKLYSYAAGTTTPQATYTDQTAITPNANPIILDANGACNVWLSQLGYKFVLQDANGSVQFTRDGIFLTENGSITTIKIADHSVTPIKMDLSTLAPTDLPANVIDSSQIKPNAVITSKIPDGSIPLAKLDPNLDLTQLGKSCEVIFSSNGLMGKPSIQGVPQYPWDTPALLSNPTTLPTGAPGTLQYSRDGKFLAIAHTTSPYVSIYARLNGVLTKLPNPFVLPAGNASAVSWSPDSEFLAVAHVTSPYITIYRRAGLTFTKVANPATLPADEAHGCAFSPDGQYLTVTHKTTPFMTVYQISKKAITSADGGGSKAYFLHATSLSGVLAIGNTCGPSAGGAGSPFVILSPATSNGLIISSTFAPIGSDTLTFSTGSIAYDSVTPISLNTEYVTFTKLSDPVTLPSVGAGSYPTSPSWSNDSQTFSMATDTTPYLAFYQITSSGISSITAPTSLPIALCWATAWSPDGQFVAVGCAATPGILIYQYSGGVFTLLSSPATLPAGAVKAVAWSPNGKLLAVTFVGSPYLIVYKRVGTTFTAKTQPVDLPSGNGTGVSFAPTNKYLAVATEVTPYIDVYQTGLSIQPNSLLYIGDIIDV